MKTRRLAYVSATIGFLATGFLLFPMPAWGQAFTVSASPASLTLRPGEQHVSVPVNITRGDNASKEPVVVTMTGLPAGVTVEPALLTSESTGTLRLSASPSAGQGHFDYHRTTLWTSEVKLVAAAGSTLATRPFSLSISISNPSFMPDEIDLPIVRIDTGGTPILDGTTDVPGTISITTADGETSYLPSANHTDAQATFQVHGNTTAERPKLPYQVKLHKSIDLLNAMGLQCGYVTSSGDPTCDSSKSYYLLANYDDKTFLRNWAASALANAIPYGGDYLDETPLPAGATGSIPTPSGTSALMPWAPHSLFVELYVNDVYEGAYQLIEKRNVDSHRVNLHELSETDTDSSRVTGGYLLEIDAKPKPDDIHFSTDEGLPMTMHEPDFQPPIPAQLDYITGYVDRAEAALFSDHFKDPQTGWRAYFDEASAVNFYIVNDVMGNVDGGRLLSSVFLYKEQGNPFLYMGPVWDFDISSGNTNDKPIVDPTVPWMQTHALWYQQLFKDPGFQADVHKQWNALQRNGMLDAWLDSIEKEARALERAQANNNHRWPMQGMYVSPNAEVAGSYDGEVVYFTNWLRLRIAYLDSLFNDKAATTTTLTVPGGALREGALATLSAQVQGGAQSTGSVAFMANGVMLGMTPLSGGRATLETSLPSGKDSLKAVYTGDERNDLSSSSEQQVTVASPLIQTVTSLGRAPTDTESTNPAHFTVSVLAVSGGAASMGPSGTMTLMEAGDALGSVRLGADGTAAISAALPVGEGAVTAIYEGDETYQGSTSNGVAVAPTVGPAEFSLVAAPSSVEVRPHAAGTVTLTVTPLNGFHQTVSLSCDQTAGIGCAFSPASVTPGPDKVTSTLTVSRAAGGAITGAASSVKDGRPRGLAIALCLGLMGGLLYWPAPQRRFRWGLVAAMVLAGGLATGACGDHSPSSTMRLLTVTATSGDLTHTVQVEVRLEP